MTIVLLDINYVRLHMKLNKVHNIVPKVLNSFYVSFHFEYKHRFNMHGTQKRGFMPKITVKYSKYDINLYASYSYLYNRPTTVLHHKKLQNGAVRMCNGDLCSRKTRLNHLS